ncbi:MAG TPA: peptidoglycan bridge formation glycyltransferase FemA/FemB family protein [Candidatus Paceibacterota bacterium]|nr:peptidoglycan bridge formation glycyltransferase FemA/FemB family protein [Candidatus Paceibacterota bacterium]
MTLINDKKIWDEKTASHPSFLQSWQWGELQEKIGRCVFRFGAPGLFASAIEHKLPFGKTYLYVPHGPVIVSPGENSWQNFVKAASTAAGKKRPVFLRIEPLSKEFRGEPIEDALKKAGFRATKPVQPKSTLIIDLRKDEKEILDSMEHGTRYSIRAAEKRGVTVDFFSGNDREKKFEIFWEVFSETNRRHGLKSYSKEYYEKVAGLDDSAHSTGSGQASLAIKGECASKIALASAEGNVISAAIFVYFGNRAFYLFAGSRAGYGKFNAPTYLLWQAMRDAKKSGYEYFDLWGISHENKNWAKITAFKKSFGGEEINSAGAWDYAFDKPFYYAYNLAKKFTG